jgi:predicted RNase H-like nuclease (RuvC/YqgF family)
MSKKDSSKTNLIDDFKVQAHKLIVEELKKEIDSLKVELDQKNKEIEVLKSQNNTSLLELDPIKTEEAIALEQLRVLNNRSLQKELTLEEVKKYDILVKNLNLIRSGGGKSAFDPLSNETDPGNLLKLAKTKLDG